MTGVSVFLRVSDVGVKHCIQSCWLGYKWYLAM